jgi:hypothetical protein
MVCGCYRGASLPFLPSSMVRLSHVTAKELLISSCSFATAFTPQLNSTFLISSELDDEDLRPIERRYQI